MALAEINQRRKVEKGSGGKGGLFGGIAGALTGGALTLATGGAAAPAVLSGLSTGYGLGSGLGSLADTPDQVKETKKVNKLESAVQNDPMGQLAAVENARMKLTEAGGLSPDQYQTARSILDQASSTLRERMKI